LGQLACLTRILGLLLAATASLLFEFHTFSVLKARSRSEVQPHAASSHSSLSDLAFGLIAAISSEINSELKTFPSFKSLRKRFFLKELQLLASLISGS